ncbi:MAG: ATP-binding protein [Clostridia bacterium]|nr:ATP-binding protein [Clostridia bacterium]
MAETIKLQFNIDGNNFVDAGAASGKVKKTLTQLGFDPAVIRRAAIAMYEGEINMVIHADGGVADVYIDSDKIRIVLSDKGPGIADVELAMKEGYSTASQEARDLGFGAGMGLPNMKNYTDEMTVNSKVGVGTTVEMIINC